MSNKFYPNCDADGFKTNPRVAYVITMKAGRYFYRMAGLRALSAWHFAGARLYLCFNDAKLQADKLRARGKDCMVVSLEVTKW